MAREKPIPIRFSARTLWFLDRMIESGRYEEDRNTLIRRLVLEGIGRAQDAGHIHLPAATAEGLPPVKAPEDAPE